MHRSHLLQPLRLGVTGRLAGLWQAELTFIHN